MGTVTYPDIKTFNAGLEWFESGLSLDDADVKFKNHPSFVAGFNYGKRVQYVNQLSYETGIEWFNRGIELDEIPENYRANEYFMNGYNSRNKKTR